MIAARGIIFLVALLAPTSFLSAAELRGAAGSAEITPPVGSPMAGYAARKGISESVHDPLEAKAIYFENNSTSLALVVVDLRRLASPRLIEGIKALGVGHVIVASTHTHSGPDADNEKFPSPEKSWRLETENSVVDLVRSLKAKAAPVRIRAGKGATYLGHNRRMIGEGGRAEMFWRNAERLPTHPVDPTLGVIQVEDAAGAPVAVLVHYACHAVVLGPDNLAISADWPGAMRRHLAAALKEKTGASPEVIFLQGAAGDINPFMDKQPIGEGAFEEMEKTGKQAADEALKVIAALKDASPEPEAPMLAVAEAPLVFENRWKPEERIEINVAAVLLGGNLGLVAFPGEPFIDFQLDLSARAPVENVFLVGYAMSAPHAWPGYIPTIEAATQGGYGAGYNTTIEVGAGETMVDRGVIELFKLKGILDPPGSEPPPR